MNRRALVIVLLLTAHATLADAPVLPELTRAQEVQAKQRIEHKWRPRDTRVLNPAAAALAPDPRSAYGGLATSKIRATGFFRTQRDPVGRWWLIDPEGHPFLSVGLNSVRANNTPKGQDHFRRIWGDETKWAVHAGELLRQQGFNTLGAWSNVQPLRAGESPLPYTEVLNFMGRYSMKTGQSTQGTGHRDYPDDLIPVFDPDFEAFCRKEALDLAKRKDDPWLLGYFSDNEMPFPDDALDRFLRRPDTDPGARAARQWLQDKGLSDGGIDASARAEFLQVMAGLYFRISREAIRAADPNHLYLGTRFHGKVLWSEPVVRAAGKHVDVLSINWYAQWTPDSKTMDDWVAWTDKPFLISEFFAKAMDSGLPNTSGAGWIVNTQADRGAFYQNFVFPLVQHPGCVGWHWFRYMDNDPEDVPTDPTNQDANKGIVDGNFKPYPVLLDAMNLLNRRVYSLRLKAGAATPPNRP